MDWKNICVKSYLLAALGVFILSVGVAFNAMARLGNDPVGIFYDGIRNSLGLSQAQLGIATYVVNIGVILLLLAIGRKYINIGTFFSLFLYGGFVRIGTLFYKMLFGEAVLGGRILASVLGCLFIYVGISFYITADVGLDTITALTMVLKDRLGWSLRRTKIVFDVTLVATGYCLGGKLGVVTLAMALTAGPVIQFVTQNIRKK